MPVPLPRLNQHQLMVMGRINRYLGRLVLDEGQKLWLKTEVLSELNQLSEKASPEEALSRGFGALQKSLGDLYQSEEWEGRSGLQQILSTTNLHWNARKPIHRTSMASRPLDRSWTAAARRGLSGLMSAGGFLGLRGPTCPRNELSVREGSREVPALDDLRPSLTVG